MSDEPRRVLVIEDDHDLASAVADLLEDEGFVVEQRYDGEPGFDAAPRAETSTSSCWTSCCPSAAVFSVCQDLRAAGRPHAAVDADGQRGRVGRGRGPRRRRRRLLAQALRAVGPDGAAARAASSPRARPSPAAERRRGVPRSGDPHVDAYGRRDADAARVLAARVLDEPRQFDPLQDARSSRRCGAATSTAIRTSSRSTWVICARRSTRPTNRPSFARCGASVTARETCNGPRESALGQSPTHRDLRDRHRRHLDVHRHRARRAWCTVRSSPKRQTRSTPSWNRPRCASPPRHAAQKHMVVLADPRRRRRAGDQHRRHQSLGRELGDLERSGARALSRRLRHGQRTRRPAHPQRRPPIRRSPSSAPARWRRSRPSAVRV